MARPTLPLVWILPLLVCQTAAQTAAPTPTATASSTDEDGKVVLSPFEVRTERDTGYVAQDNLVGGRLNINLLKDPNDVSVLTRDFLDDIAAWNTTEAALWLPNSAATEPTDSRDFGGNVQFRGLPTTANTRDYFPYPMSVDEYVIERYEGARGTNAVNYSDAAAGGRPNVTTKRARFHNSFSTTLRTDSNNSYRATFDLNRVLTKWAAVRINAMTQDRQRWIDRWHDKRSGVHGAVTIRPWANGELRLEAEYGDGWMSTYGYVYTDASSLWDQVTTTNGLLTSNPAATTGLSRFTTDTIVFSPGLSKLTNFRNLARTNGTGLTLVDEGRPFNNFPSLASRSFRIAPDESRVNTQTDFFSATFTQTLPGEIFLEAGAASCDIRREVLDIITNNVNIDVNRLLPDGSANPNFGKVYSTGNWQRGYTPQVQQVARLSLARAFDFKWLKSLVGGTVQSRREYFSPRTSRYARVKDSSNPNISPNVAAAENNLQIWRYWDDSDAPFALPGNRDGYEFIEAFTRDTRRLTELASSQVNMINTIWDDRLTITAGIRRDKNSVASRTGLFNANGYRDGDRNTLTVAKADTMSVGGTFFPRTWIGVYANYAEGFNPQGDENPWVIDPIYTSNSVSRSAGLRFNLGKQLLVGSVGYYKTLERNRQQNVSNARTRVNQLWTDLNMADRQIAGPFGILNDTLDFFGEGWEADFVINPIKGARMRLNLAFPETSQQNPIPNLRAYFNTNLSIWEAGINDPTNPNRTRIAQDIDNLRNTLTGFTDGRTLNGTYKWRANVFGNYEFQRNALKGWRVGGGAAVFGKRLIGNGPGSPFDYIYAQEYFTVAATLGYRHKYTRFTLDASLNVSNLLDYDEPVYSGVTIYQNAAYRGSYTYIDPRVATLTIKLTF